MAVSSRNYLELVRDAYRGKLKLPAFQRDWAWKAKQTAALFDSIRLSFPIGAFLFSSISLPIDLGPRSFRFSSRSAKEENTDYLVLDGQQRITAGVQLFYGTSSDSGDTMHFFLDIAKLRRLYIEYCDSNNFTPNEYKNVDRFVRDLDYEDGYIVGKKASKDPYKLLIEKIYFLFRY